MLGARRLDPSHTNSVDATQPRRLLDLPARHRHRFRTSLNDIQHNSDWFGWRAITGAKQTQMMAKWTHSAGILADCRVKWTDFAMKWTHIVGEWTDFSKEWTDIGKKRTHSVGEWTHFVAV